MTPEEQELAQRDRIAYLLARRMTGVAVAKRLGIAVKEVYKFSQSPTGRRQIAEIRLELLQGVKDAYVRGAKIGLATLVAISMDPTVDPKVRTDASKALADGKDIVQAEEAAAVLASAAREREEEDRRTALEELPDEILIEIARFRAVRQGHRHGLVASNSGNGHSLEAGAPGMDAPAPRTEADS